MVGELYDLRNYSYKGNGFLLEMSFQLPSEAALDIYRNKGYTVFQNSIKLEVSNSNEKLIWSKTKKNFISETFIDGELKSKTIKFFTEFNDIFLLSHEKVIIYSQFSDGQMYERILIKQFENYLFECDSNKSLTIKKDLKEELEFSVYPNPTDFQIQMKNPNIKHQSKLLVSDIEGNIILFRKFAAGSQKFVIKVDTWASGLYLINIENSSKN